MGHTLIPVRLEQVEYLTYQSNLKVRKEINAIIDELREVYCTSIFL